MKEMRLYIPETMPNQTYPGDIKPGYYETNEVVKLMRDNAHNPKAIQFIADMLEE
jgi:hypothetical protein